VPLIVISAGKRVRLRSSRDWAGERSRLLGVRAVIAQSYERIHRRTGGNGIWPLQFLPNETPESLGPHRKEVSRSQHSLAVLTEGFPRGKELVVKATRPTARRGNSRDRAHRHAAGSCTTTHRGILEYVLRDCLRSARKP